MFNADYENELRKEASSGGNVGTLAASVAIVIVTFNRASLLENLLESILCSSILPDFVVVVDNCSNDHTQKVIERAKNKFPAKSLISRRLPVNIGGSGGFSCGVQIAFDLGADWFWLMDDDVLVEREGLEKLQKWSSRFQCIHGRRLDFNGSNFFWQPIFNEWLGLPLPYIRDPFANSDFFLTNSGCFEGMFISRQLVRKIGLPDPRFFITWDDAMYGWLASKYGYVVYVNEFVLKRARVQRQVNLGIRHLNDASDLFRFHVVRNRAYVKRYLQSRNSYCPVGFFIGSVLNFLKEIFRMVVVERKLRGLKALGRGILAARKIDREKDWLPMPPL